MGRAGIWGLQTPAPHWDLGLARSSLWRNGWGAAGREISSNRDCCAVWCSRVQQCLCCVSSKHWLSNDANSFSGVFWDFHSHSQLQHLLPCVTAAPWKQQFCWGVAVRQQGWPEGLGSKSSVIPQRNVQCQLSDQKSPNVLPVCTSRGWTWWVVFSECSREFYESLEECCQLIPCSLQAGTGKIKRFCRHWISLLI